MENYIYETRCRRVSLQCQTNMFLTNCGNKLK
ncbi:Uncharacterized protein APZ42_009739 [Daphnia magna]|uniref:Uncharacterized protein n=1 Tax=Daphnia magna TaxID=35525 RepID=A0A164DTR7_9CRUS|nr:Uncharacterized protein APZ42_009739 [Daphnia magna]